MQSHCYKSQFHSALKATFLVLNSNASNALKAHTHMKQVAPHAKSACQMHFVPEGILLKLTLGFGGLM